MIIIVTTRILAFALAAVMMFSSGNGEDLGSPRSSYDLGSAACLNGKNLLYSLYVNTPESRFYQKDKEETLRRLNIAAEYIEDTAKEYRKKTELVYDWQENTDLTGTVWVNFSMNDKEDFEDKLDEKIAFWVENKIDFEDLCRKYRAKGIALIVFVNNPGGSYAIVYDGTDNQKESLVLFQDETPAVYAHEILHVFGAHDLYKDAEYTQRVTDYVKMAYPTELMYTVTDAEGNTYDDEIVNMISPITAYHLGWSDYTEEIDLFPELNRKQVREVQKHDEG